MFRVFKLTKTQLHSLLPVSEFETLETAISACCRAMNSDQSYDEESLRSGLALAVMSLKSPLQLLRHVRQWALECLGDPATLALVQSPLTGPPPPPSGQVQNAITWTKELTPRQARGILANVFFANCFDPVEAEKDLWNQGGLDWRPLLANKNNPVCHERMHCHLLYFEASSSSAEDNGRCIVFERIRFKPKEFLNNEISSIQLPSSRPVGAGVVLHGEPMEKPPRRSTAFVNFANRNFGYGKFIGSCTQEEILESCCPEFTVGMLWIGKMEDNEVVNVRNIRRFCEYSGYLRTFRCEGPLGQVAIHDVLSMDASIKDHFTEKSIERDMNKVYAAFAAHATSSPGVSVVSTGKWGCGIFGGLAPHKFLQQALAANLAGLDMDFSAFGDNESCDIVLKALQESKPTAADVAKALKVCRNKNSFVEDFLAAMKLKGRNETILILGLSLRKMRGLSPWAISMAILFASMLPWCLFGLLAPQ